MITHKERASFLEHGYLAVEGVLAGAHLATIQEAFDTVWEAEGDKHVTQHGLLKYRPFIELIEHPPILDRHRAIFGNQVQLLQYDLLRQGPHNTTFPVRRWHRDFTFPGERPLAINTILFLDDIRGAAGPTRVVPGTHHGEALPPAERRNEPLEGEVSVECPAGTAIFINAAIWHTGARNESAGLRRGIYLYYGYWWLKRYESTQTLPWQALEGASEQRLRLLGYKMPDRDLHMYAPE
jgi:ectoine hydroxylase-related dioxygenase (phytanoyl-CoA dioxygenase family)